VRKQFSVQAVAPLIYNLGTIVGGLFLVRRLGVSSLAIGTLAGAFLGPFLLNVFFARGWVHVTASCSTGGTLGCASGCGSRFRS